MDPITQGVLGGVIAQTRGKPKELAKACVIGALAGMAPGSMHLRLTIRGEEMSFQG